MPVKTNRIFAMTFPILVIILLSACSTTPAAIPPDKPPVPPDRVDVVYFYSNEGCSCGIVVSNQINSTLFFNFSEELNSGKLTFQSFNLDDKGNSIIASKYSATPISLFLNVVTANDEYVIDIPEITLVQEDEDAVKRLVIARVRQALDGEK